MKKSLPDEKEDMGPSIPKGIYKKDQWLAITISPSNHFQGTTKGSLKLQQKGKTVYTSRLSARPSLYDRYCDIINDFITFMQTFAGIHPNYTMILENSWYGRLHFHGRIQVHDPLYVAHTLYYLKYDDQQSICVKPEYETEGWEQYITKDDHKIVITQKTKIMSPFDVAEKLHPDRPKPKETIDFFK